MAAARIGSFAGALTRAAVILLGLLLAACGDTQSAARFMVPAGQYVLYDCAQIAQTSKTTSARQHELEGLMAKASTGSGGQLVNAVAYQPEYLTLRGEMMDLRQAALDKKCDFVPGEPLGANEVSSQALH